MPERKKARPNISPAVSAIEETAGRELTTELDRKAVQVALRDDNPLALLPPQLAQSIVSRTKPVINPDDGQFDGEHFCGYDLPADLTPERAGELLQRLEEALPPITIERLAQELSRVRVLTKGRNLDDADAELTVIAFAENLAEYPGQLVVEVLRYWPRTREWFPTWMELHELLQLKGGRMLAMIEALRSRRRRRDPVGGDFRSVASDIADAFRWDR